MGSRPASETAPALVREALIRLAPEGVLAAYVFGSTATGRAHAQSDLDVGVLFDRQLHSTSRARFDAQLELRRQLSPAVIGRELDVVVLNDASPLIGRRIIQDGVCVYTVDDEADLTFRRDVQLRAADLDPFIRRMRRLTLDALAR